MSGDCFFTAITWLGSLYVILPSSVLLSIVLLRAGRAREALLLGLSLSATVIAVHAAKLLFRRPRPDSSELLVPMPADWSFPSAHTAQATAFYLILAIILSRSLSPTWSGIATVTGVLIVIAVGWSRIYLQVHYLSDVIAGWALAIILVAAVHFLLPYLYTPFGD